LHALRRGADGYARFTVALGPWEGRWWKAQGGRAD